MHVHLSFYVYVSICKCVHALYKCLLVMVVVKTVFLTSGNSLKKGARVKCTIIIIFRFIIIIFCP